MKSEVLISYNREGIIKREQEIIKTFFNTGFIGIPSLSDWITDELIQYWKENMFHIHYVPNISLDENLDLPLWKTKPSKTFYKKIREGKLREDAKVLSGKWLLIDGRDKPKKNVPWIRINDVQILERIGFNPRQYLKKWNKQLH